jgi:hypothetical protein
MWLLAGLTALLLAAGCRRAATVVDTAPAPPPVQRTITGVVRSPESSAPISGRTIAIINVSTGEQQTVTTGATGGFTIQVPAGKYRLDLPLRDGETLVKRPDDVELSRGDGDSRIEFVLGAVRVLRPRGPAYRLDNGLGSPIA